MTNRFRGENTRLITDIIVYCKINQKPCIILLADFEKAFDSINWNFFKSCIKHFGFGPNFQTWINVMYCNIHLLADFEKAFDSINWNFFKSCIKHFGFGPNFQTWINVMYCNIQSCVSNNGCQTPYFTLHRGIRQGCPKKI